MSCMNRNYKRILHLNDEAEALAKARRFRYEALAESEYRFDLVFLPMFVASLLTYKEIL